MGDLTQSQFYMWRTLFALIHADNVVAPEELRFAAEALEDINFTFEQEQILRDDLVNPKDPAEMFAKITNQFDQIKFFKFAAKLVWVDGNYAREEKELMLALEAQHIKNIDLDAMIGHVDLEFEDASDRLPSPENLRGLMQEFKTRLFK